jgi:hypothetical protein
MTPNASKFWPIFEFKPDKCPDRGIEQWQPKPAAAPVNLTKETPPLRQYVQVNVLPGRDNLPPPPPDNLIKDAPDNPA